MTEKARTSTASRLTMAMVVALLASTMSGLPGNAAEPEGGTLRWGETVAWSGGPFSAFSNLFTSAVGVMAGRCPQDQGVCDEFLLDVQLAPSPSPILTRFVDVEVEASEPGALTFSVIPPGGDPSRDFLLHTQGAARLTDPDPGVWRIWVGCFSAVSCEGVTYGARATTGAVRAPAAVAHRAGGELLGVRGDVRGHVDEVNAHAFEPTLGIADDGSIFYQGIVLNPVQWIPKVLRSTGDGGWEDVSPRAGPLPRHPNTNDPFLHLDPDTGRVFTVDYQGPTACHQLSFTDDDAEAWTTTAVCGETDFQKLFTGPPALSPTVGYPNVVYLCGHNGGVNFQAPLATSTTCSKSLDGGITFVPTGTPAFHDDPREEDGMGVHGHCSGVATPGVVGDDGTVYLPGAWCGHPYLAISHDEGATWERVQVSDMGTYRGGQIIAPPFFGGEAPLSIAASVGIDEAGTLYYAWVARDRLPYLAISRDGGQTWGEPMMIAPPGVRETIFVDVDAAGPGEVAFAYMGSETSPGPPFPDEGLECQLRVQNLCFGPSFAEDPDAAYADVTWNGYLTVSDDALADRPEFLSAPLNDPADPLVRGRCGPFRCLAAGDFFDVKIAEDGTPWAAFTDACFADRCTSANGQGKGIVGRLTARP